MQKFWGFGLYKTKTLVTDAFVVPNSVMQRFGIKFRGSMKRLWYIKCWNSAVDNEMMNKFQFSTVHQKLLYIDVLNFAVINFILNRCKSVFPQALVKNARSLIRRRKANRPKVCRCVYWRKLQWYGIPCPFNCSISCPSFALPATHKAFCYKEKAVTEVAHTSQQPSVT